MQNLLIVNINMKDPHMKNSHVRFSGSLHRLNIWKLLIVCFLSLTLELKRHVMIWPPCEKTTESFAIQINMHGKIITVDYIYNCTKPCGILEAER